MEEVRIPVPGIAATDPHELPRNSDGVFGSQRGGTLAAAAPGISLPGFAAAFLDILKSYKASPRRIALKYQGLIVTTTHTYLILTYCPVI